jgi:UDP-galactose transporter B1
MMTRSKKKEMVKTSGQLEQKKVVRAKGSPLHLLVCASGITSCYLLYGTIQEKMFHMDRQLGENGHESNESITLFLLATSTFSSFLLAWIWTVIGPILLYGKEKEAHTNKAIGSIADGIQSTAVERRINHPLVVITSITYLTAMAASNESLHYVSYPTCVLAKSSKLIPTMVVGWLVEQWRSWRKIYCQDDNLRTSVVNDNPAKRINAMEWAGAALITIGILSFQYIQLNKQSNSHGRDDEQADSPYGLALLGLSLFMDGLLGACQSALKQKDGDKYRPPSAMETMLFTNLYATLILLPASYYAGQFQRGIDSMFFSKTDNKFMLLMQLNLSASLGQVFVFLTIHHFSPLICTTITTTRKFFTILLSVYKFGHVLNSVQWLSIALVFAGLYLEIFAKLFEGHDHIEISDDVRKKKQQ